MPNDSIEWSLIEKTVQDILDGQNKMLLKLGRRIVPTLTTEDMLQPNDYHELENHPEFRYEEGVLCGMQTILVALRAAKNDLSKTSS